MDVKTLVLVALAALASQATYSQESTISSREQTVTATAMTAMPTTPGPYALPAADMKKVRLVAIVGPVGEATATYLDETEATCQWAEKQGIQVSRFYTPNNDWATIKKACADAHILIYMGHGSPGKAPLILGSGELTDASFLTCTQVATELKLRPKAVVFFGHVCGGAGSSAGDEKRIGDQEAISRVSAFAKAFQQAGAGSYYATSYNDDVLRALKILVLGYDLDVNYLHAKGENTISQGDVVIGKEKASIGYATTTTLKANGKVVTKKVPSVSEYERAWVGKRVNMMELGR